MTAAPEEAATTIVPAGWVPLGPALAWIGFGSAEADWDERYYFGASHWAFAKPERVAAWLDEVAISGDTLQGSFAFFGSGLGAHVRSYACRKQNLDARRRADGPAIRAAASELRDKLNAGIDVASRHHDSLALASDTLRRAVVAGSVSAYGWPGEPRTDDEPRMTEVPRARIPPDVCAAPITITQHGLLPFVPGDWIEDGWSTLWHGVLIPAEDLLKLRPAPTAGTSTTPYQPPAPKRPAPSRGGRPPHPLFKPFAREMVRRADLDGLEEDRSAFTKLMTDWAANEFDNDTPGDTTIRDWVAELWPHDQPRGN